MKRRDATKEHYQRLRALPWRELWTVEVPRFDAAPPRERFESVSVIRAVAVVFAESGPLAQREEVKRWLVGLLGDAEEKVRRYAVAALPKIGVGAEEERQLLALLQTSAGEREQRYVGAALDKVGSAATLERLATLEASLPLRTQQRVQASVARSERPSGVRLNAAVAVPMRLHLRGRVGLEGFVREEVEAQGKFRVVAVQPGLVEVEAQGAFTLGEVFALRCFGTVGLVLGEVKPGSEGEEVEALAGAIASPAAQQVFDALTDGAVRYRLEFIGKGHQRGRVRRVVERAYALCPRILNDSRQAPWAVDIHPTAGGESVELRPRISPDPRHPYRLGDVPAASHPPLAACMARLAGPMADEMVWDPFCGSALELIERVRLGGVRAVFGTDVNAEAVEVARRNFAAAQLGLPSVRFNCGDFRDFAGVRPGGLTLIITNPPLGQRVPIPNLRGLFEDLFDAAAQLLAPGGRLVFTNPFHMQHSPQRSLALVSRQRVDMGGFECRLEMYRKTGR